MFSLYYLVLPRAVQTIPHTQPTSFECYAEIRPQHSNVLQKSLFYGE